MNYLLSNKKIAQATHNISAYRIKLQNGGILQVKKPEYMEILKINGITCRIVMMMEKLMQEEDYCISYRL